MLSNREDAVINTYANMGEKNQEWGNCSILRYIEAGVSEHWENTSMYSDTKLIGKHLTSRLLKYLEIDKIKTQILRFADFGGAEGYLAQTIQNQLKNLGFPSFGISIDKTSTKERNQEFLQNFRSRDFSNFEKIYIIGADLTSDLNIEPNSLDFGIIRNTIQYCGQDKTELLKPISRYIKKGGLIIAQNPICTINNQANLNQFSAELSSVLVGGTPENWLKKHYFPTIFELVNFGEKLGLETLISYEATDMPILVSVENTTNGSRFKIPASDQIDQIKALFQKYFQSDHYLHIPGVVVFRKK